MSKEIGLPSAVKKLWKAHEALRRHFADTRLTFTLDGKLVGDIGEAIAARKFGIRLTRKRTPGVDGHTRKGKAVQIKATGKSNGGPAFSSGEGIAEHLLFLQIDFRRGVANVAYNGPEAPVRKMLPKRWNGTKVVPISKVRAADKRVPDSRRLARVRSRS